MFRAVSEDGQRYLSNLRTACFGTMTKCGNLSSPRASQAESENGYYWTLVSGDRTDDVNSIRSSGPVSNTSRRRRKSSEAPPIGAPQRNVPKGFTYLGKPPQVMMLTHQFLETAFFRSLDWSDVNLRQVQSGSPPERCIVFTSIHHRAEKDQKLVQIIGFSREISLNRITVSVLCLIFFLFKIQC